MCSNRAIIQIIGIGMSRFVFYREVFFIQSVFYQRYNSLATSRANKWKNHFSEMKGDVGMSPHEKEGKQGDAYTKTETHS